MTRTISGIRIQLPIGEGACGQVFRGTAPDGTPCAVKLFDPDAINADYLGYCFNKVLALPPHHRLVPILQAQVRGGEPVPYCAMALLAERIGTGTAAPMRGRTLERFCGKVYTQTAWRWLAEIAEGVAFLHTHAIVHCNLKPGNVFLTLEDDPHAQVADFGQGWLGGVAALPLRDHVFFAPPEQLEDPLHVQFGVGEVWDVYAFGALAFRLLTGRFPRCDALSGRLDDPENLGELPEPDEFATLLGSEPEIVWPQPPEDDLDRRRREVVERCLFLDPLDRWADMREVRDALAAIDRELADEHARDGARAERDELIRQLEHARAQVEHERAQADLAREEAKHARAEAEHARTQAEHTREETRRALEEQVVAVHPPRARTPQITTASIEATPHAARVRRRLWIPVGAAAAVAALAMLGFGAAFLKQRSQADRALAELADLKSNLEAATSAHRVELASRQAAVQSAVEAARRAEQSERSVRAELTETQLAADHFFGSFLDAARQLPAAAGAERTRLIADASNYFDSFIERNASRPEMAPACLRARCHLAEIRMATGSGGEAAERFEDARTRIDQWLAANPDHGDAGRLRAMAADCALIAALLRQTGPPVPESARNQLREAVAFVDRAVPTDLASPRLRRRTAEARLALARALQATGPAQFPESLTLLNQAAESMNAIVADAKSTRPEDKLFLAGIYFERGRIERASRNTEAALATQVQAAELLLECGNQPDVLYQLALCYGETGEMLDANAEQRDAARAHGEAVKILSDLVKAHPQRTDWQLQLAIRYANIAQLVRDHSEPDRALDYQKGAVQLLDVLVAREPGNPLLASQLARRRADLSDLLAALGKKDEALVQAREAIALLDKLGAPGKPVSTPEFTVILSAAQTYGVAGHVTEEARQTAEAAQCFSKAVSHYEALASARAGDDEIERGLTWSRMRLAKLKN